MRLPGRKTPEQRAARAAAVKAYSDARDELERVSRRDREETEAYHEANDAVWKALENPDLPWWRR